MDCGVNMIDFSLDVISFYITTHLNFKMQFLSDQFYNLSNFNKNF